ncbi:MAG: alpha-isopropylmalate synthase regulatory domain-containing protein [Bacillota bacterium]
MKVEIMDTTLRDGEQTPGVAFKDIEKLNIAKMLLDEINVDRIEVASAGISQGEFNAVQKIMNWAHKNGYENQVEVLGLLDKGRSLEWINKAKGKVVNLLCKGSLKHLTVQLGKTLKQHVADIKREIKQAEEYGIKVNIYLEDWSNGIQNSPDYVFELVDKLKDENIERFMLPDTLGIFSPDQTFKYCKQMKDKFPDLKFDFHAHNDYGFGVANTYNAARAGMQGLHTTVNGLGERTGNNSLANTVAVLKDHLDIELNINEKKLIKLSNLVETFSGQRVPNNKPIVGENVFTQDCGIHADGDNKGNLYQNKLTPERFGRQREYALGKTSGKASIAQNLKKLGIELDEQSLKKVTAKVIELGDKKENITVEDLLYIVSDVSGSEYIEEKIKVESYNISYAYGLKPVASLKIIIEDQEFESVSAGDGQYDAFMRALEDIYNRLDKKLPLLKDYIVTIPPGGKTNALVETMILWEFDGNEYQTRGLDSDQTASAIKATIKMLNLIETGFKF